MYVSCSWTVSILKMEQARCPGMSVGDSHSALWKIPKEAGLKDVLSLYCTFRDDSSYCWQLTVCMNYQSCLPVKSTRYKNYVLFLFVMLRQYTFCEVGSELLDVIYMKLFFGGSGSQFSRSKFLPNTHTHTHTRTHTSTTQHYLQLS
jgi:hypothetical protein